MSPLPSPTPVRSVLLRVIFSPVGLLCGFVFLLIATCPGARGEDSMGMLSGNALTTLNTVDIAQYDVPVAPLQAVPVPGRSSRSDRAPVSSARSATPSERALRAGGSGAGQAWRTARPSVPVLVDPLLGSTGRSSIGTIRPMTGPPVGIRPEAPVAAR